MGGFAKGEQTTSRSRDLIFALQEFPSLAYYQQDQRAKVRGGQVPNKGGTEKFRLAKFLHLKSLMPGQKYP